MRPLSDGAEIKVYDRIWITEDLKISSLHDRKRNERLSLRCTARNGDLHPVSKSDLIPMK
jgi:hypothetical protein